MDLKERFKILETKDLAREYPHGSFAGMTNRTGRETHHHRLQRLRSR
jgi:hypothetical protein